MGHRRITMLSHVLKHPNCTTKHVHGHRSSAALTAPGPGTASESRRFLARADGEAKAASTPRGDGNYLP